MLDEQSCVNTTPTSRIRNKELSVLKDPTSGIDNRSFQCHRLRFVHGNRVAHAEWKLTATNDSVLARSHFTHELDSVQQKISHGTESRLPGQFILGLCHNDDTWVTIINPLDEILHNQTNSIL